MKLGIKDARIVLTYAGIMGHRFAVISGKGHLSTQCNTFASANESAKENGGTVYKLTNKKWGEVKS